MAQKRMFDRDIISGDSFTEMPSESQNLYFHLGVQADDEGFVSPKGIMRMISCSEDSLKVLIAKNFVIPFKSGVVVITAWNQNNWLDSRRIKPTQYQKERKLLALNNDRIYALSGCLASASPEESSIEENRIEQSSIEQKRETPAEEAKNFFEGKSQYAEMLDVFAKDKNRAVIEKEFEKFVLYWTEPNGTGTKQRWQQQPTFDVKRRLVTWLGKINSFPNKRETKIL